MASSERKRKHRRMRELGWVWDAVCNEFERSIWPADERHWVYIRHLPTTNKWVVEGNTDSPAFNCYLTAAIWAAVEVSNG